MVRIVFDDSNNVRKLRTAFEPEAETEVELIGLGGNDTLGGSNKNDTLDGGVGDDQLDGGPAAGFGIAGRGNDLLLGGDGNDQLFGGDGSDTLDGGIGNDTLFGQSGSDSILGGEGNDEIFDTRGADTIDGGGGNDRITSGSGLNSLIGGSTARGGAGNDILIAEAGNNLLDGGEGDDQLSARFGGRGNDTLIGGTGNDTVSGRKEGSGVDGVQTLIGVNRSNGAGRGEIDTLDAGGSVGRFRASDQATDFVILGEQNLTFYQGAGNADFARVDGFQLGLDKIQLNGAPEQYVIGNSPVSGITGTGIFRDNGNRFLDNGDDLIAVLDSVTPQNVNLLSDDFLYTNANVGGNTPKVVEGKSGPELIQGSNGNDTLGGGAGNDTILGAAGNDSIDGGIGDDSIDGGIGDDRIKVGALDARDVVDAGDGNDTVEGGSDRLGDTINGGLGNDSLTGGGINSLTLGGAGNDTIRGGKDGTINGGTGNDEILAQGVSTRNDRPTNVIIGSDGTGIGEIDRMVAGLGNDLFVLRNQGTVLYDDGNAASTGTADFALIQEFNGANDRIELVGDETDYLIGNSPIADNPGEGLFLDTNQNQRLDNQDELIAVVQGRLNRNVNLDFDRHFNFVEISQIEGKNRSETIRGSNDNGYVDARGGADKVNTRGGDDVALGGNGQDTVSGGSGNDTLEGGNGRDLIKGNGGDDILCGSKGIDTLIGGGGSDIFMLESGTGPDVIQDYRDGIDKLAIGGEVAFEDLTITQLGNNTMISLGANQLGALRGIQTGQITAEDFTQLNYIHSQVMDIVLPTANVAI